MRTVLAVLAAVVSIAAAKTYLEESFNDGGWESRWVVGGKSWGKTLGPWTWAESLSDASDKGIKTGADARHYALSSKLSEPIQSEGKPLVLSYTVRHDQKLDCGGAYIKLWGDGSSSVDQSDFSGSTDYAIMFGPDVCGTSTRRTHLIFTYKGKNLLSKKNIRTETDNLPHRYTLVVNPDNTYEVQIDGSKVEGGSLFEDWDFLLPKEIDDPSDTKPEDWVDDAQIPDPAASKPAGWDDVPEYIPDKDAKQPEDWDEAEDGDWEAPQIKNPEYQGPWKAPLIPNPAYKGVWKARRIPNPDYVEDPAVYNVCRPCSHVGFELWQVKAGSFFDDIIVTDSLAEAQAFADKTFLAKNAAEKAAHDAAKEAERKREEEERKRRQEEADRKKKEAEENSGAGEDDEDDEL